MPWLRPSASKAVAPSGFLSFPALPGVPDLGTDENLLGNVRIGFERNELVYACVMEKATSLPEAPLRVFGPDGLGEPLEAHPLRRLVANPNPVLTEFELIEFTSLYLDLAGLAAWEIVRDQAGRPAEVWPLRPDLLRIFPRSDGHDRYGFVVDGGIVPLGEDVVVFRLPNLVDAYVGQPPLRPAMRAVRLDNTATDFVTTLLDNRAVPGIVITTQEKLDDKNAERLRAKWRTTFGGNRRGEPAFMSRGMEVHPVGLDPEKLEFPDLRTISETRICAAFGVPPILVGAKAGLDRSTFANYAEARKSFWEETLTPLQMRMQQVIVKRLLPLFTGVGRARVTVRFDRSDVLALRESERTRWELATQALRAGAITVADFRRHVGLPAIDGTDVFLRPAGVLPTRADGTPAAGLNDAELSAMVSAGLELMRRERARGALPVRE